MAKAISKNEVTKKREEKLKKDLNLPEKELEIISGKLVDDKCNYAYELKIGKTAGDIIERKGNNIAHKDLVNSFKRLHVFLALIDDAFKNSSLSDQTKISVLRKSDTEDLF